MQANELIAHYSFSLWDDRNRSTCSIAAERGTIYPDSGIDSYFGMRKIK
jgi:hypothetical protein